MTTLPMPQPGEIHPQYERAASSENWAGPSLWKEIPYISRLLSLGETLCGCNELPYEGMKRFYQEFEDIMQGQAKIHISAQGPAKLLHLIPSPNQTTFPLQFRHLFYGTLAIESDPVQSKPVLSPPIAQLLAQVCSWLLYMLEQSIFIRGQCQQLDYQVHGPLTKREREILTLMCQGCDQNTIAEELCIAPQTVHKHRQHIYERLDVHCERDAILVAYHVGLFSLVKDVLSQ